MRTKRTAIKSKTQLRSKPQRNSGHFSDFDGKRKWMPVIEINEGEVRVFFKFKKGSKELIFGFSKKNHAIKEVWIKEVHGSRETTKFVELDDARELFKAVMDKRVYPVLANLFDTPRGVRLLDTPKPKHAYKRCEEDGCRQKFVARISTTRISCFECYPPRKGWDYDFCDTCGKQFQYSLNNERSTCWICELE